jgi:hypothetical protein
VNSPTTTELSLLDLVLLNEAVEKAHRLEECEFTYWWETDPPGTTRAIQKVGIRYPGTNGICSCEHCAAHTWRALRRFDLPGDPG